MYSLGQNLHSHCCWFYKASSIFLCRGSHLAVREPNTKCRNRDRQQQQPFWPYFCLLTKCNTACWPDTLGKGNGQGCIWLSVSPHMLWTSCAESLSPPSPAVSLPLSSVQLLLIVLGIQGGSVSTGTLSTAAPVKCKGKGGRDCTLCPPQGEDRPCMASLSKSENHSSVVKQSNQMGCQDSAVAWSRVLLCPVPAFSHALGSAFTLQTRFWREKWPHYMSSMSLHPVLLVAIMSWL